MDRERVRHGLGIAIVALAGAAVLAAVFFGGWLVLMSLVWNEASF